MGLFLSNKASHINTIVTSSLFHLMIMAALASLLLGDMFNKSANSETILVEMAENAPPTANDNVWAKIRELGLEDQFEFIPKEESIKLLQADLGEDILLDENNPLRDLFQIVMKPSDYDSKATMMDSLRGVEGVEQIFEQKASSTGEAPIAIGGSSNKLIPLVKGFLSLIIGILTWIYFKSKASEIISSSKEVIASLSLYGTKPAYFKGKLRKFIFGITFKSWLLSLLLFLLLFHLTLTHFGHGISDISISKILIIVFAPLFILLVLNNVLISRKLDHSLKSI